MGCKDKSIYKKALELFDMDFEMIYLYSEFVDAFCSLVISCENRLILSRLEIAQAIERENLKN